MRVQLQLDPKNSQSATFQKFIPHISAQARACRIPLEWSIPESGHPDPGADVVLVQQSNVESPAFQGSDKPYILLESRDGADLTMTTRKLLCGDTPPAAVWKYSRYVDPALYNAFHGRLHQSKCADFLPIPIGTDAIGGTPRLQIPAARLGRIKAPFGFGSHDKPDSILRELAHENDPGRLTRPRAVDVSFAGTVSYSGSLIEAHRLAAAEAVEKLNGRLVTVGGHERRLNTVVVRGRGLGPAEYRKLLYDSSIVVSPYGWGEMAYRDYEAIFAGCTLIKPHYYWVDEFQSPFQCCPDFSDLSALVVRALDYAEADRLALRSEVVRRHDPREIGLHLWNDIRSAATQE